MRNAASRNRLIRDGICRAILSRMKQDKSIVLMGEGAKIKQWYDCREIHDEFADRILTLPISEDSNTNFAVGCAIAGLTPICDVITADFLFRTMDSICNTAAKNATVDTPRTIVIRAEHLTGGPTTGQRFESMFARIPGLSVCVPSNPVDACGLMLTALSHKGVTIFLEDREIPDEGFTDTEKRPMYANPCWTPEPIPFGRAHLREGWGDDRTTLVTYGLCQRRIVSDPTNLARHDLIDLRTLWPLDMKTILQSVARTGRLLVVEPAIAFGGIGAEIVASVACALPGVRCQRLGAKRETIPTAREHHEALYPSVASILAAI